MVYKRSTSKEIAKRNAEAYLGTKEMQKEANENLKKWKKGLKIKKSKIGF